MEILLMVGIEAFSVSSGSVSMRPFSLFTSVPMNAFGTVNADT